MGVVGEGGMVEEGEAEGGAVAVGRETTMTTATETEKREEEMLATLGLTKKLAITIKTEMRGVGGKEDVVEEEGMAATTETMMMVVIEEKKRELVKGGRKIGVPMAERQLETGAEGDAMIEAVEEEKKGTCSCTRTYTHYALYSVQLGSTII